MNPLTQFIEAARFLTRVPVPAACQVNFSLSDTFLMFPVVGVVIGAFSGALLWASIAVGLPPVLAAVGAVGGAILFTGGLHEDGLGDVADGFGGGSTREQKLDIMRDSRLGTYGVLALVLTIFARLGALTSLLELVSPVAVALVLIASAALSRGAMVGLVTVLPSARTEGLSAHISLPPLQGLIAYILALAFAIAALVPVISGLSILIAIMCALVATFLFGILALRHIGGHTGDVAGASQQIAEITCLFAVVALV